MDGDEGGHHPAHDLPDASLRQEQVGARRVAEQHELHRVSKCECQIPLKIFFQGCWFRSTVGCAGKSRQTG